MSWTKRITTPPSWWPYRLPIEWQVLNITGEAWNLAGHEAGAAQPGDRSADKYPPLPVITARATFTIYGAFIEIEEGHYGLLHFSDMMLGAAQGLPPH